MGIPENTPELPLDYAGVDASPSSESLIAGMDTVTRWPAVQQLRAWESERMRLRDGETLLDVGCGSADAGLAIVAAAGPRARLEGLDASETMLSVARERAERAEVEADFRVGDAQALPYESDSLDAVRTERTLQWLPDPGAALVELVRVLRPGGRLTAIDTDWSSLTVDVVDHSDFDAFLAAAEKLRGPGFTIGRQLLNRFRDLQLRDVTCTAATHVLTAYDREEPFEASGLPRLHPLVFGLVGAGLLDAGLGERVVAQLDDLGRTNRVLIALTMYAACGWKP